MTLHSYGPIVMAYVVENWMIEFLVAEVEARDRSWANGEGWGWGWGWGWWVVGVG